LVVGGESDGIAWAWRGMVGEVSISRTIEKGGYEERARMRERIRGIVGMIRGRVR